MAKKKKSESLHVDERRKIVEEKVNAILSESRKKAEDFKKEMQKRNEELKKKFAEAKKAVQPTKPTTDGKNKKRKRK